MSELVVLLQQIDTADKFVEACTPDTKDATITAMAKSLRSTFSTLPSLSMEHAVKLTDRIRQLPWGDKALGFLVDTVTTKASSMHVKACLLTIYT